MVKEAEDVDICSEEEFDALGGSESVIERGWVGSAAFDRHDSGVDGVDEFGCDEVEVGG